MDFESVLASLEADSKSEDQEVSARAKRMLTAMAAKPEDDQEGAPLEEPVKNDTEDNDSGGDADDAADSADEEDPKKKAVTVSVAAAGADMHVSAALAQTVDTLSKKMAKMEAEKVAAERAQLLKGQSKEIQASLKGASLETVRSVVSALSKVAPQAVTTVAHTQMAKAEPGAASAVPKSVSDQIAKKMRIQPKEKVGFKEIKMAEAGRIFYFSVPASYDPRKSTKDAG